MRLEDPLGHLGGIYPTRELVVEPRGLEPAAIPPSSYSEPMILHFVTFLIQSNRPFSQNFAWTPQKLFCSNS